MTDLTEKVMVSFGMKSHERLCCYYGSCLYWMKAKAAKVQLAMKEKEDNVFVS
jgi:hypothetical protein